MNRERRSARKPDEIQQQNTPLIDVVFQLLTFFIMSFKVVSLEGDFQIKMPVGHVPGLSTPSTAPFQVRLEADTQGELARISVNGRSLPPCDWEALRTLVIETLGRERGPGSLSEELEITLDCDSKLRYDYAMQAITAVTGRRDEQGAIVPLAERVRFAPPRAESF